MSNPIQLVVIHGELHYPPDPQREYAPERNILLLRRYPEGDCDAIAWPFKDSDLRNIGPCLFDDRELGIIGDQEILLPDGTSAWNAAR